MTRYAWKWQIKMAGRRFVAPLTVNKWAWQIAQPENLPDRASSGSSAHRYRGRGFHANDGGRAWLPTRRQCLPATRELAMLPGTRLSHGRRHAAQRQTES